MLYKSFILSLVVGYVFLNLHFVVGAPKGRQVQFEIDGRVINGTLATAADTKHQVSIRKRRNDGYFYGTGHVCGGSLIAPNIVLSAAHCFVDYNVKNGSFLPDTDFIAVMGTLDRFEKNNNTLQFDIDKIVYALTVFNLSTYEDDIALLFLNDSVPEHHPTVQPINITTVPMADGTVCQVTGWGQTEKGYLSDQLMTLDVPIINFGVCANDTDFSAGLVREGMLCAGYLEGGRDACGGDSGGPLVCDGVQAGIVSWGIECAKKLLPGVYTDVAYWSNWISKHIAEEIDYRLAKNGTNGTKPGGNSTKPGGGGGGANSNFSHSSILLILLFVWTVLINKIV